MKRRTAITVVEARLQSIATADTHPSKQYEEIVAFAAKTKNGVILRLVHCKSLVWLPVPLILLLIVAVPSIITNISRSAYSPPAFRSNVTANYEVSHESFDSKSQEAERKARAILDMEAPFIHIVNSRFQQHDKNLSALGAARYELFEAFCLPSMVHQTIQPNATEQAISSQPKPYRFIWIIKVDPKLDPELKKKLVKKLQPYPNFYLVGSNNNFGLSFGGGSWRNGKAGNDVLYGNASTEITSSTMIYTGDVSILQVAHDHREEKIILETRLDADDGLPVAYLESIQKSATEDLISKSQIEEYKKGNSTFLKQPVSNKNNKMKWMFWCMPHAYNWYPSVLVNGSKQSKEDPGHVTMERNSICLTTGLTSGISVGVDTSDVPRLAHHKVLARLKLDKENPRYFCGIEKKTESCIHVLDKVYPMRARTPTSDGMNRVSFRNNDQDEIRSDVWDKMFQIFRIEKERAANANDHIDKNLVAILKENLAGQCSHLKGRLCVKSKKNVQALINAAVKAMEVRQGKQQ